MKGNKMNFWKQNRRNIITSAIIVLIVAGIMLATTYKYSYPTETTLAETDGYGGAVADLAADSAYDYTGDIDLETNGYYGMWLFVEHDSSGTTDDIIASYFPSYDGTNFDDVASWSVTIDSDGSDDQISFQMVPACPHGRIGLKTTGTTDTFDYQVTYIPMRGDGT
jgi:hypothetical protein